MTIREIVGNGDLVLLLGFLLFFIHALFAQSVRLWSLNKCLWVEFSIAVDRFRLWRAHSHLGKRFLCVFVDKSSHIGGVLKLEVLIVESIQNQQPEITGRTHFCSL